MEPAPSGLAAFARRQSTTSTSCSTTASTSSNEQSDDTAITPASGGDPSTAEIIKQEDLEHNSQLDAPTLQAQASINTTAPIKRKRGRPRKHVQVEHKSERHKRSRTGCETCRRRKKKCGEEKPICINCQKNNIICDGYEQRRRWNGGQRRALCPRSPIASRPSLLVDGIDAFVDQFFLQHFIDRVAKALCLIDHPNPFIEIIIPMAMRHTGLMHSLLWISADCLIAKEAAPNREWEHRSRHHCSKAIRLLHQDLASFTRQHACCNTNIADDMIAQMLMLCFQAVCAGDMTGSYRLHLDALKEMLSRDTRKPPNDQLRRFVLQCVVHIDYCMSITSLRKTIDQRSVDMLEDLKKSGSGIDEQHMFLGVHNGLFESVARIRHLRDAMRQRSETSSTWDEPLMLNAFSIEKSLEQWRCVYPPENPHYVASLLYKQSIWVYLQRTLQYSRPSLVFREAVDEGLEYMRVLLREHEDDPGRAGLLMPLFLLGCAAFEPCQRVEISNALRRLHEWSGFGKSRRARMVLDVVWEMMDKGREEETWDWESILHNRDWNLCLL